MTTPSGSLGDFLAELVHDEDAAQKYLLDPKAALAAADLSRITADEASAAADRLGLQVGMDGTDPIEIIRIILQRTYIRRTIYLKILSGGDLSHEFDTPKRPVEGAAT